MKNYSLTFVLMLILFNMYAQKPEETEDWSKKPAIVTPGSGTLAPSDAIMLYSGPHDADKWMHADGSPIKWNTEDAITVTASTGAIKTKQEFGDVQLHIEWRSPSVIKGDGQGRGNSGVFLMGKYEVQVLDCYENETYYNGQAGSIYKQYIPLVNACRKPGEWQTYDIIFKAPRFNTDSTLNAPAFVTVIHNGVLIQNHIEIKGGTKYIGQPEYVFHPKKMPLELQDHGDAVSFRNIWIREL